MSRNNHMLFMSILCNMSLLFRCIVRYPTRVNLIGSLRYGDYGLRTTAGRALSFVRSTGLSGVNIER